MERWERVCEITVQGGTPLSTKAQARLKAARLKYDANRIDENRMIILIGGTPSSGTSILLVRLASHKWALGVNETGLFSHPGIQNNFEQFALNYINIIDSGTFKALDEGERLRKGLSPHLIANTSRLKTHGLTVEEVIQLLIKSKSGHEYMTTLTASLFAAVKHGPSILIEKTPSNLYALPNFLDGTPNRRGIAIVRDPLDLVSSLVNRGVPLFRAMAMWTVEAALALIVRDKPGGFVIRYEDLVGNPEQMDKTLLSYIGMAPAPRNNDSPPLLEDWPASWRNSPLKDVSTVSVGRGLNELDAIDRKVFGSLTLKDFPGDGLDNFIGRSAQQIATSFGYQIDPEVIPDEDRVKLRMNNLVAYSLATDPRIGRSCFYDRSVTPFQ
jgi:hypothetical protein